MFDSATQRTVDNFTSKGPIDNNLVFKCETDSPAAFEVQSVLRTRGGKEVPTCEVTARSGSSDRPKTLVLRAKVYSREDSFNIEKKVEFPFHWEISPKVSKVSLNRYSEETFRVKSGSPLEVTASKDMEGWVSHHYSAAEGEEVIVVRAGDLGYPVEGHIKVSEPESTQSVTIPLIYDP